MVAIACQGERGQAGLSEDNSALTSGELAGVWIRDIRDGGGLEGLALDADGTFGLLGIQSMDGMSWRIEGRELVLETSTERYPKPMTSRLQISEVEPSRLVLEAGADYLAGTYRRDDDAGGRITGTVTYRQRIALPDDAVLLVRLEDASIADAPSTLIAQQTIPAAGRQIPIPFAVHYLTSDIDERFTYTVSASIVYDDQLRFRSADAYAVINNGESTADIRLFMVGGS